ncbi:MAG: glucose sorbosone dehydrogenase [Fibrobacteres bacterium]|nr:glucose sorbosone dehydrogenase [Fibrobacterota bacterium]
MPVPLPSPLYRAALSALALLAITALSARAQVGFKNAFPGLTFKLPVYFGELPGVPEKTYVVLEQHEGAVTLVTQKNGAWTKSTFLKMDVHQGGEMGLLGIAFHPDFRNNRKYYINYDPPGNLANIIAERQADATLLKDAGTMRELIRVGDKYDNHNGGTLAFGPKDGFLYAGMGDGGSGYDPDGNGQNKNSLLAKMLRIDVDKKDAGREYAIPTDNPFASGGGRGEIFAYGLRNPWKWSFDPVNGDLWVGDVGQDTQEEVDIVTKGSNQGWSTMEGTGGDNNGSMNVPVFTYDHNTGKCIIGGVVYRGNPASKYYGTYFVTDIDSKTLWTLKKNPAGGKAVSEKAGTAPANISSFGTDAEGRVYATGIYNGTVYMLDSPDLGPAPTAVPGSPAWKDASRRILTAAPGSRLDPSAFGTAAVLGIHGLDGRLLATVARETPGLPIGLKPGIYFASPEGSASQAMVLMVR